jgi:hypothetical protein
MVRSQKNWRSFRALGVKLGVKTILLATAKWYITS